MPNPINQVVDSFLSENIAAEMERQKAMPRKPEYDCSHIDTCLPCYLQDHHNREGELLLSVPVDRSTRNGSLMRQVIDELGSADFGLPDGFDYEEAEKAIRDCFAGTDGRKLFDSTLDKADDEGESCYAHFLLTYSE